MIKEELLAAYAEGSLKPADRVIVEAAAAHDPSIARRLMDQVGKRRRNGIALVDSDASETRSRSGAVVVDLAAIRASRSRSTQSPRPEAQWRTLLSPAVATAFVAASLVAGLVIGAFLTGQTSKPQVIVREGALYADGLLSRALKSAQAGSVGPVLVGTTVQTADGRACRAFRFHTPTAMAGVACRSVHGWRLEMTLFDDGRPSPSGPIFPPRVQAALADMERTRARKSY